ncbi:MAG: hypothetical protein ACXWMK_12265, partial [Syntrophales bacterium]
MISPWLKWIEPWCLARALLGATEGIRLPFGSFLFMVRRFLFIIFLFLPSVGYALPHTNGRVIDYTLRVSFNIQASKTNEKLIKSSVAVEVSTLKTLPDVMERVAG